MAGAYFLLHTQDDAAATPAYDWTRHRLRVVTAGSPRAFDANMCQMVDRRLQELAAVTTEKYPSPSGGATVIRIVRDKDVVPTVPPEFLGFRHATGSAVVFLPKRSFADPGKKKGKCYTPSNLHPRNYVLIDPCLDKSHIVPKHTMKKLLQQYPDLLEYYEEPEISKDACPSHRSQQPPQQEVSRNNSNSTQRNDTINNNNNARNTLAQTCTPNVAFPSDDNNDDDDDDDSDNDAEEKKESERVPRAPQNGTTNGATVITATPSQYDKYIQLLPRRLRDHCPDFYLEPLHALRAQLQREEEPSDVS
jgi:hypothetical protein